MEGRQAAPHDAGPRRPRGSTGQGLLPPWPQPRQEAPDYQPPTGWAGHTDAARVASRLPAAGLSPHGLRHGQPAWMVEVRDPAMSATHVAGLVDALQEI